VVGVMRSGARSSLPALKDGDHNENETANAHRGCQQNNQSACRLVG
jgi:hypothetical protein